MKQQSLTTAVILAAGQGVRLGERSRRKPKGLIEVGGEALLERSVRLLMTAGIRHIFIVTGHLASQYEERFADVSTVECVYNPDHIVKGNAHTLYCVREHVEGRDFLLLESDLLYEQWALTEICNHPAADVLLASSLTGAGDEVFIEADARGGLVNMSKERNELGSVAGELVGISKISAELFSRLCLTWETVGETEPAMNYEQLLIMSSNEQPMVVHVCDQLIWCEIDDEQHLRRANEYIYPRLP